jgi:hypothetical protein
VEDVTTPDHLDIANELDATPAGELLAAITISFSILVGAARRYADATGDSRAVDELRALLEEPLSGA